MKKQSEYNQIQAYELFEAVTKGTDVIIAAVDTDYNYIFFNEAYKNELKKLTGKDIQIGTNMLELFADVPEQQKIVKEEWSCVFQGKKTNKRLEFGDSNRRRRVYSILHTPLHNTSGNITGAGEVAYDITEQVQAEEELKKSEKIIKDELVDTKNYLNNLLEYANAPIIVWNPEFRITKFNRAFERLTQYKFEEIIGKDLNMLFPEYGKEEAFRKIQATLAGEFWEVVEIPIMCKNGDVKIYLWNSANIYTEDKKTLIATIAQGQDITERICTEKELELMASFPEENPYPVLRVSKDGVLQFANAASMAFCKAWNCELNATLPLNVRENILLCIQTGQNLEIELYFDKQIFLTTFAPFPQSGYVNIYGLDITNRKKAEEEVVKARDELEERVRARTMQLRALALELTQAEQRERKRLAGVLHDNLQQLLVGAKWAVQGAQKKTRVKDIQPLLDRTSKLLEESISASKSLVLELSPPILYESGLVAALKWLSRWMEEKHGLAVEIKSEIEVEPDPEGVCVLLFQSVRELLFNVIKHSEIKTAQILVHQNDGQIKIEVTDQGIGFDPVTTEHQNFEFGYGLFSIRERLNFIGGNISIESAQNKGTRVLMSVPLPRSVTYRKDDQITKPQILMQDRRKRERETVDYKIRVLIADDHKIMREGLHGLLNSLPDIDIVGEATDGENAVELAKELRPDIVIMDVNMPRLNGIEATRRITNEVPSVRVIGLSMHEETDRAEAMLKAGAVDYVHKAGPSQDLILSIRTHCKTA